MMFGIFVCSSDAFWSCCGLRVACCTWEAYPVALIALVKVVDLLF